jgi:hypothetical protein
MSAEAGRNGFRQPCDLLGRQEVHLLMVGLFPKSDADAGSAGDVAVELGRLEDIRQRAIRRADRGRCQTLDNHLREPGADVVRLDCPEGYVIEERENVIPETAFDVQAGAWAYVADGFEPTGGVLTEAGLSEPGI